METSSPSADAAVWAAVNATEACRRRLATAETRAGRLSKGAFNELVMVADCCLLPTLVGRGNGLGVQSRLAPFEHIAGKPCAQLFVKIVARGMLQVQGDVHADPLVALHTEAARGADGRSITFACCLHQAVQTHATFRLNKI